MQRIRELCGKSDYDDDDDQKASCAGVVECYETYIGGTEANQCNNKS